VIVKIAVHVCLEAIGGAIMVYALGFCRHRSHQFAVWFTLALFFSFVTVQLIG
jgi:RsiW-degrading membrane proteinase PrsW (M82 family)